MNPTLQKLQTKHRRVGILNTRGLTINNNNDDLCQLESSRNLSPENSVYKLKTPSFDQHVNYKIDKFVKEMKGQQE